MAAEKSNGGDQRASRERTARATEGWHNPAAKTALRERLGWPSRGGRPGRGGWQAERRRQVRSLRTAGQRLTQREQRKRSMPGGPAKGPLGCRGEDEVGGCELATVITHPESWRSVPVPGGARQRPRKSRDYLSPQGWPGSADGSKALSLPSPVLGSLRHPPAQKTLRSASSSFRHWTRSNSFTRVSSLFFQLTSPRSEPRFWSPLTRCLA